MRRSLAAAALALVALAPTTSPAAFTTLLDPLIGAVESESTKLDALTDKASRRKQHLLDDIVFDLRSSRVPSVTGDVGLLKAASKPLLKLFGTTYAPVADAYTALKSRVGDDITALEVRAGTIVDPKTKTIVDKVVVKAQAILDAIVPSKPFPQRVGKVRSAALAVESGNKRIDADAKCPKVNPPNGRHGGVRATIGTREFTSIYQSTSMVKDKLDGSLKRFVLTGTRVIGGQGDTVSIFIENHQFHGAGTYPIDGTNVIVIYEFPKGQFYNVDQGAVDITLFDAAARDLRGTFTGDFVGVVASRLVTLDVKDAAFESCNWADSTEL